MAVIGWVDTETDLSEWLDAPDDPATLKRYLDAAHEQCLEYAPAVPDVVPARFVLAQVMQARALYRSAIAGSDDGIGGDGLAVTVFPMDWTVKNLLRPKRVGRVL